METPGSGAFCLCRALVFFSFVPDTIHRDRQPHSAWNKIFYLETRRAKLPSIFSRQPQRHPVGARHRRLRNLERHPGSTGIVNPGAQELEAFHVRPQDLKFDGKGPRLLEPGIPHKRLDTHAVAGSIDSAVSVDKTIVALRKIGSSIDGKINELDALRLELEVRH